MSGRDEMILNHKRIRVIKAKDAVEIFPNEVIVFSINGMYVPSEPFGSEYFLTNEYKEFEIVKVKSLTLKNLFIHAFRNTMYGIYFRFLLLLYKAGLINHSNPYEKLSIKEFTLNFAKTYKHRILEDKVDEQYNSIVDYMEHMFDDK